MQVEETVKVEQPSQVTEEPHAHATPTPQVDSPAVLAQMQAMARQQEALHAQSQQVQELIQQMRLEQSELTKHLEDMRKQAMQPPVAPGQQQPQAPAQEPNSGYNAAQTASEAAREMAATQQIGQDVIEQYSRVAQQDLRALQELEYNGCHISDSTFRGTPAQLDPLSHQQGITRAEAALYHASGVGSMLLPTTNLPTQVSLDLEEQDTRTVDNVLVQFLSLSWSANGPRRLKRCYLRFQFFDLKPSETPVYLLEPLHKSGAHKVRSEFCLDRTRART